jgi:hypothetical protein
MDTQLPRVNAALKAAGQAEIVPSTDELGAPPPPVGAAPPPEGDSPPE